MAIFYFHCKHVLVFTNLFCLQSPTHTLDQDDLMSIPLDFWSPVLSASQESPQLSATSRDNAVQPVAAARNVQQQQPWVKTVQKISGLPWATPMKKNLMSPPVSTSTARNVQQQLNVSPLAATVNNNTPVCFPYHSPSRCCSSFDGKHSAPAFLVTSGNLSK